MHASVSMCVCVRLCLYYVCHMENIYDVRSSLIQPLHHHHHHGDFKLLHILLSIHLISFFCCIPPGFPFVFFLHKVLYKKFKSINAHTSLHAAIYFCFSWTHFFQSLLHKRLRHIIFGLDDALHPM